MLVTRAYEMKSWNHIKLKHYILLRRQKTNFVLPWQRLNYISEKIFICNETIFLSKLYVLPLKQERILTLSFDLVFIVTFNLLKRKFKELIVLW